MIKLGYPEFLALFPERPRKKAGNGWLVLCPAHNDHVPSLWVQPSDNPDFIARWECKAGSCKREDVLKALNLTWDDVRRNGTGESSNIGDGRYADTAIGITLAQLAEVKRLRVDFLNSLGITDGKLQGLPVVRIPYMNEDGQETAVRFRQALHGARFRWRKGDHTLPYGLNRLAQIRGAGWVLIVEGESDCWTCWYHGVPALGAPGKGIWPTAWAKYLDGLKVYVWQEPDAQDFTLRLLATAPALRYITAPDGIKDISEAHIQRIDIPKWLEGLKSKAESGRALKERATSAQMAAAYEAAQYVIESEDPLKLVAAEVRRLGYGGDLKPVIIVYLSVTSRLLRMRTGAMPVHLLLIGPPSAGKNFTVSRVLILLPADAFHVIDAGSPRVLIYDDGELRHKTIVFSEADSLPAGEDNPAASAIRNLLQDHRLHYQVVIRDPMSGEYVVRDVDKPGPTNLITTSTKSLGNQLMTRLFTLQVTDTPEQIGAALEAQAALETEESGEPDAHLIAFQTYLQARAPIDVAVPFARELAAAMKKMAKAPRILRDFARLISLIKATAIVRQAHRHIDGNGRIVAEMTDYKTVRDLVNDMYVDSSTGATVEIRKLIEAVVELHFKRSTGERITQSKLADHLGITKLQASRRARRALLEGWLVNRERRKFYPADYEPGEPMPDTEGLPTPNEIQSANVPPRSPEEDTFDSFRNGDGISVSPPTDDAIPSSAPSDDRTPGQGMTFDHYTKLGMSKDEVLKRWRAHGKVVAVEGCFFVDLEVFLNQPGVTDEQLEAIRKYLEAHPTG